MAISKCRCKMALSVPPTSQGCATNEALIYGIAHRFKWLRTDTSAEKYSGLPTVDLSGIVCQTAFQDLVSPKQDNDGVMKSDCFIFGF